MYTHLRFVPKTPWQIRSGTIAALQAHGLESLKPAFPGSDHPVRSAVYAIAVRPGMDSASIQEFIKEADHLIGVTAGELGEIAVAPYPEPPPRSPLRD